MTQSSKKHTKVLTQNSLVYSVGLNVLLFTFLWLLILPAAAQEPDVVETYQDDKGWKIQVNGEDFYVKGVVWSYTPKGENYAYNLWDKEEKFIKKVLDQEFGLMKAAGINAIRTFGMIPPEWITYIYQTYGIRSVVNHLFGRYGFSINGTWKPNTNYQDPLTRNAIKRDVLATVEKYKNTPGLLMFALGNENNYGLHWSSFEIENLPDSERHKGKAKYLYSLYNETIKEAKLIDSSHPYIMVNGDIQYLDLIKEYCTDLDILGVNAYRGENFTTLWADVKKDYDLPVLFMEFGSDAFNALTGEEAQREQAYFLKKQWQEMYSKAYGRGKEGSSIGGFVFQWRDEWWKYKQFENLDVHDRTASWSNGGYPFDHEEGMNNMNEEWWGIARMGDITPDGIYTTEPRVAYHVLAEIWKYDPYNPQTENVQLDEIKMELMSLKGEVESLKSSRKSEGTFKLAGGRFEGEIILNGNKADTDAEGMDGLKFTNGEMLFLDFELNPTNEIRGQFSVNILGNVAEKTMEITYGGRGEPVVFKNDQAINGRTTLTDNERLELYDFELTYENSDYSLSAFYHVPRYHWGDKGDFFGLLYEATDLEGMDMWNSKPPFGVEFIGKKVAPGLTVLFGPEVYWGANPKVMLKYDFSGLGNYYTLIHSQDFGRLERNTSTTDVAEKRTSKTTLYAKRTVLENGTLEMGAISSSQEKIGDHYDYVDGEDILEDEITLRDTLGLKAKLTANLFESTSGYLAYHQAGLVADGGNPVRERGTQLPYSGLGNKKVLEGGLNFMYGDVSVFPRFFIRENLLEANPSIDSITNNTTFSPGVTPRNREDDPFAVLDNRKAKSAEIVLTWDPTPASYFYEWNNDKYEDAPLAFNLVLNKTEYQTSTDANLFLYLQGDLYAPFAEGLAEEDVWLISSRMVMNLGPGDKIISTIERGFGQTTGLPGKETRKYTEFHFKYINNQKHIHSAYIKWNAWGPYDYHRQFDIAYPKQAMYDYSRLIDPRADELASSKWGIKLLYRSIDESAPADEYRDGTNEHMYELTTYYKINF